MARYRGKHAKGGHGGLYAALVLFVVVLISAGLLLFPGIIRGRAAARPPGPVDTSPVTTHGAPSPTIEPGPVQTSATPSGPALRADQAAWVIAENLLPGTRAWQIPVGTSSDIEGYADHVSAQAGDTVRLFVSTAAKRFHVEAYRLGYYGGLGGRFVWRSAEVPAHVQPEPTVDPDTNMVEAGWSPSLTFSVGSDWTQGEYVLKLVSSSGAQGYVPLTVRDDESDAALVVQSSVATWQAYNDWGGHSLYVGPTGYSSRARIVSFDRPYDTGRGGGALVGGNELPIITLVEKLGLDVTYWTDLDLHERPALLLNHHALITLGHDEYWSTAMRDGALAARGQGVNIAFLGANAVYRHIRMQPSPLGANREEVDFKSAAEDPMSGTDDAQVTVNWRLPPLNWPESQLLGPMYECNPVRDDMVIVDASNWLFAKAGVHDGDRIAGLVGTEYDRVMTNEPTPRSLEVLAHSPVDCHGLQSHADMTYYTSSSGAGVFDSATSLWTTALGQYCVVSGHCGPRAHVVLRVTVNLLRAFAAGPSGLKHPSATNLDALGLALGDPIDP